MRFAFLLTLLAGLSTILGGFISFFVKKYNLKVLSVGLGFSAGAMIYVSLVELIEEATALLAKDLGKSYAGWVTTLGFLGGISIVMLIDLLLPQHADVVIIKESGQRNTFKTLRQKKLLRTGMFTLFAITIHNLPEGLATFSSALVDKTLGVSIALAVAIHNIPAGIAISLPVYYATGNKRKAIFWSFVAGISEPVGALIGFKFFNIIFQSLAFGILFASTAGIMVYISFDELLPTAKEYGNEHLSIIGVILGMLVMAISLNVLMHI